GADAIARAVGLCLALVGGKSTTHDLQPLACAQQRPAQFRVALHLQRPTATLVEPTVPLLAGELAQQAGRDPAGLPIVHDDAADAVNVAPVAVTALEVVPKAAVGRHAQKNVPGQDRPLRLPLLLQLELDGLNPLRLHRHVAEGADLLQAGKGAPLAPR